MTVNMKYSRTPIIRNIRDGEPNGYAENPNNWISFLYFAFRLLLFTVFACV